MKQLYPTPSGYPRGPERSPRRGPVVNIIPFQSTARPSPHMHFRRPRRVRIFFLTDTSLTFLALIIVWLVLVASRGPGRLYADIDLTLDNILGMLGTMLLPGTLASCIFDWLNRHKPTALTLLPRATLHSGGSPMKRIVVLLVASCALALPRPAVAANVSGQVHFNVTPKPMVTSAGAQEKDNIVIWLASEDMQPTTALPPLTISQHNLTFSPAFQVLTLGQELRLPNDDDVAHNVYAMNGPNHFNFGIYKRGEFRSIRFNETGVVELYCSLHKDMHARLFVVPTPLYATALPGEQFSIHDVPPGHYVLKAWSFRAAHVLSKPVTVPKTGTTNLNLILDYAPSSNVAME